MKKHIKGLAVLLAVMVVFALAACGGSGKAKAYRVITVDESGAPVKGVNIQFCSDTMCYMGETDDNGVATFADIEEGKYTVHVYRVPEGFAEDTTEYEAPGTYGDVTITLKAA